QITGIDQHALQGIVERFAEIHQHITALLLVQRRKLYLNAVECLERLDLQQLPGLDVEADLRAERVDDQLQQLVIAVGLEQHGVRQTADHYPFAQRNGKVVVVVDVRVGGEKGLRVGIGLSRFIGNACDFIVAHAAGADQGDEFKKLGLHGAILGRRNGRIG